MRYFPPLNINGTNFAVAESSSESYIELVPSNPFNPEPPKDPSVTGLVSIILSIYSSALTTGIIPANVVIIIKVR